MARDFTKSGTWRTGTGTGTTCGVHEQYNDVMRRRGQPGEMTYGTA